MIVVTRVVSGGVTLTDGDESGEGVTVPPGYLHACWHKICFAVPLVANSSA